MAVSGDRGKVLIFGAQGDSVTGPFKISYIRWVGATTAGHSLSVTDDGDVIFASTADGANFIDIHPYFKMVNGITATTMQSGTLYVYTL